MHCLTKEVYEVSTADEAWEHVLTSEKIHHDGQKLTSHDIIVSMLYTYARLQKEREKTINGVLSMSRLEYEENKREHDPHWWEIAEHAGGWSNAKKVLPVPQQYITRRNRRGNDASAEKFSQAITKVAQHFNVQPHEVSVRQFMKYKHEHPEDELANWKVYARYIAQSGLWNDAKMIALVGLKHTQKDM